ncbi:hypothetical protein HDU84_006264 [Entophlyctis sp. JEL0112]|nr:hypothetical protein HDU84_006264 [Entophlyctis sp. JEL0112]
MATRSTSAPATSAAATSAVATSAPTTTVAPTTAVPTTSTAAPASSSASTVATSSAVVPLITTTAAASLTTSTGSTTTTSSSSSGGGGASVNWAMIGGIAGGVAGAILIVGLISFFTKANRQSRKRKNPESFDALYNSAGRNPNANASVSSPAPNARGGAQNQDQRSASRNDMQQPIPSYPPQQPLQQQQYYQQQPQGPYVRQQEYQHQQFYNPQVAMQQQQQQQHYYPSSPTAVGGTEPAPQQDYTAEWQRYFAENPGAYEAYLAQQQQQQQLILQQQQQFVQVEQPQQYYAAAQTTTAAPAGAPQELNAADYDTYEEFVAAQQAYSMARVAANSGGQGTLAYYNAEAGISAAAASNTVSPPPADIPSASGDSSAAYEARIRAKIEKEAVAVNKHAQQDHTDHPDDDTEHPLIQNLSWAVFGFKDLFGATVEDMESNGGSAADNSSDGKPHPPQPSPMHAFAPLSISNAGVAPQSDQFRPLSSTLSTSTTVTLLTASSMDTTTAADAVASSATALSFSASVMAICAVAITVLITTAIIVRWRSGSPTRRQPQSRSCPDELAPLPPLKPASASHPMGPVAVVPRFWLVDDFFEDDQRVDEVISRRRGGSGEQGGSWEVREPGSSSSSRCQSAGRRGIADVRLWEAADPTSAVYPAPVISVHGADDTSINITGSLSPLPFANEI